jgi:D-glycero-alpha-D-manno-heptose-7-phosphate kinase
VKEILRRFAPQNDNLAKLFNRHSLVLLSEEKMYRSRAPVRIDFAGGTTDISPFCDMEGGAVVSASINLYAHASFHKIPSGEIRLHSLDYDKFIEAKDIRSLEYDGNLDLVKAALRRLNIPSGMELRLFSDAPPGSGLGSSAAMGVAILGLLNEVFSLGLTKSQIAELEFTLETKELSITGGRQDQYAAAFGGINFMTFTSSGVTVSPLNIDDKIKEQLEERLILCYTGQSRLSGNVNQKMIGKYIKGEKNVQGALRNIKRIAEEIRDTLKNGELDNLGELFNQELKNRRIL